jgi:cysteine desulfuration protein SufE
MSTMDPTTTTDAAERAQDEIVDEFSLFGDWTERYQYLIDLGRKLADIPAARKTEQWKVAGCQSQVWIVPHGDATRLEFEAISDSAIVSGLIALLLKVYSGREAAAIMSTEPRFIDELGLRAHLSGTRSNGLAAMFAAIRRYADEAAAGSRWD